MSDLVDQLNTALADRYSIERELGQGGMATVYLAKDLRHDRRVALKVLRPELAAAVGAERFLEEIKLTASLQHPHILPLHDSGESEGALFYVMPFAEGESLRDRLDREKQLSIEEAIEITRAVASALDYAHRHEVVHRDIKPENILLLDGQAVVADFGIALAVNAAGSQRLTEEGVSVGTPTYMSPEQATGERVDGRADTYSLAAVLYEMLAGQPPYTDTTLQAMVARLLTEQPVRLKLLRETVSDELDETVMKGLAKVPADRFPTADAFSKALVAATAPVVVSARSPGPLGIAMGAGAVTVIAFAAFLGTRSDTTTAPTVREERQLTFDGSVQESALAPQGDFFAYLTFQDGVRRVFVREVGSTNAILLDSLADFMCCVAWSPDGSQLAYQRGPRRGGSTVIVPRLGGARRTLQAEVAVTWSADASKLLSWWPAARELTITDVQSATIVDVVPLGDNHTWVNSADWGPTGDRVTVALQDSIGFRVQTMELDGTVVEELASDTVQLKSPQWGLDGAGIYYVREDEIWNVPVSDDGRARGEPRLLMPAVATFTSSTIVPAIQITDDGSRLLYNRFVGHSNLWRFSGLDGSGGEPSDRQQLTRGTASRVTPRISPDGSTVAYVESVEGTSNLFTMPVGGGTPRQLTFFERTVWSPAWSPDGSMIAIGAEEDGEDGLWLVDVASATLRRAEVDPFEGDEIAWGPSPEIIYQIRSHLELRAVDPETWSERVLRPLEELSWWYDLRVAPDARSLLVRRTGGTTGLWAVDLASGEARSLSEMVRAPIGWRAGGTTALAMSIDGRAHVARDIYVVPAAGGEASLFLTLPLGQGVNSRQVAVSPDGSLLIASVPVSSTDVWLVEGFDPR